MVFSPSEKIKFAFQFFIFFILCPYPSILELKYCILHVLLFEMNVILSTQAFSDFYFYFYSSLLTAFFFKEISHKPKDKNLAQIFGHYTS